MEDKVNELVEKGCEIIIPDEDRKPLAEIERSIIKRYRKHLEQVCKSHKGV